MGAFRIALEAIYNSVYLSLFCRIHPIPLAYTSYGRPNPFVYGNAETMLRNLMPSLLSNLDVENNTSGIRCFRTLYMIGDNPKLTLEAGDPWFSILTRTRVFKGKDNHSELPMDVNWIAQVEVVLGFLGGKNIHEPNTLSTPELQKSSNPRKPELSLSLSLHIHHLQILPWEFCLPLDSTALTFLCKVRLFLFLAIMKLVWSDNGDANYEHHVGLGGDIKFH